MSWPSATLGSIATIDRLSVQPNGTSGRYIGLEHITSDGAINIDHGINAEDLSSSKFSFTPAHILFGKLRPYLRKVARPSFSGICSTDILPIHPNQGINKDYLFHYLRTPAVIDLATARSSGANLPRISPTILSEFQVPVPPLEEQKRIAAILDKADAIRRKREQAIKLADEFLRSLFLEMFGDPVRNPKGWPKEPLIKLLDRIESGWSPLCESRIAAADEWAILKLGAVTKCVFDSRENKAVLPGCVPRPDIEVKDGDVLFSRKNTYELVAACALVVNPPPRLMMSDLIFRLRIRDRRKLLPEYLWQVLIQPSLRGQIQALAGGSAGSMPNISKERLMSAVIPVPPADLQLQFAARLAKLNTLKARCADICAQAENLCVSLTDRAFHGSTGMADRQA